MSEPHRTTPLQIAPLCSIASSNMSSQTRTFGDRTFNAIGYGGMGLSLAYGAVGTVEERLKVQDLHFPRLCGSLLTLVCTKGSGCRLRVRVHLLGHC